MKRIEKKWLIVILLISFLKLVLMCMFSSDYQDGMFRPFVGSFLDGNNPYDYYWKNDLLPSFPYFPFMLIIESFGAGIIKIFGIKSIVIGNLVFKLPLLFFDLIGLSVLLRFKRINPKYVVVLYFCSPIILYGTYMHGQLDIIPTVLLLVAVYYMVSSGIRHNYTKYAVILGLALSTKIHILAAVPLLFLYVLKREGFRNAIKYHLIIAVVIGLVTAPFFGDGFIETVLLNKEQSVIMSSFFDYSSAHLILPLFVIAIVYYLAIRLSSINKNLLISFLCLLFGVFLICIPAMPAWYTWVVPFLALFFGLIDTDKRIPIVFYATFNLLYSIYYVFFHRTQFVDLYWRHTSLQRMKVSNEGIKNTVFTMLISCLSILLYEIYKYGMLSNNLYRRKGTSFAIGISGDSGAGKSRMMKLLQKTIHSPRDVLEIEGDGDHRWERGNENWNIYTALNPLANFLYKQADDIKRLKEGGYVLRRDYDHDNGIFTSEKRIYPKKYILVSGLHALYLPQLRSVLDLKIFLDTDEKLKQYWKIHRDSTKRGYTIDEVKKQMEIRSKDAEKYIYPQKAYADIIVSYYDENIGKDCYAEDYLPNLGVKIRMDMNYNLEPVVRALGESNVSIGWKIQENDYMQEIDISGEKIPEMDLSRIAERIIPQYEDLAIYEPDWEEGINGLIQLVLLYLISEKMKG